MRHFNALVLDEDLTAAVTSAAPMYTSADLNSRLAQFDQLALQYVATNPSGTTPSVTVAVEHSADGRNWLAKNATAEINAVNITSNPTYAGFEPGTNPSLGLVRLKIFLSGTSPACHLKLYTTARDQS